MVCYQTIRNNSYFTYFMFVYDFFEEVRMYFSQNPNTSIIYCINIYSLLKRNDKSIYREATERGHKLFMGHREMLSGQYRNYGHLENPL